MSQQDEQLVDLQSRVAFQEKTLNDLDQVVVGQQQRIELLERAVEIFARRLGSLEQNAGEIDGEGHQPPPHY